MYLKCSRFFKIAIKQGEICLLTFQRSFKKSKGARNHKSNVNVFNTSISISYKFYKI